MKTILIAVALFLSLGNAYASRSQIITMPDGSQMICYYYNGGRIVDCVNL